MTMQPSALRGFNYQPGHSAVLQYTWTNFDRACWEREVPTALRFGSNTLRIWLDWSAYLAVGPQMLDAVESALQILDHNNLKMMPVLFNRWTDPLYPAGGVSTEDLNSPAENFAAFAPYVTAMMERFANDERIVMWDLCNEPQAPHTAVADKETAWLRRINEMTREHTEIPITIGTMSGDNVRNFADLVDVISFHPYTREIGEMKRVCEDHLAMARELGKPLLCTEMCCGSLDDFERGALARDNIETLEEYGIGWLAWQLASGLFVTGSRERTDSNAVRPGEGYMPFVLPDGSTRPGHEWLERA